MTKWVKIIPLGKLEPAKLYFIGRTWGCGMDLLSRGKNGKLIWAGKPGIGLRFKGSDELKSEITKIRSTSHQDCKIEAIEVPANADKRWRARQ